MSASPPDPAAARAAAEKRRSPRTRALDLQARARRVAQRLWSLPDEHPRRSLIALLASLLLLLVAWERCGVRGCPNVERLAAFQPGGAPVLLDRDGEPFADLTPVDYTIVPLESLPDFVAEAFIAVEDQRFMEHSGIDWRRVFGAALADLRAGGFAQGFSTITMQLARNVFPKRLPGERKTLQRKLLEVRVAGEIEEKYSKAEILELYLNHIYFGGSAYGIDAAARTYFGKPASDLTLREAATLAAMPKAPNSYDPRRHPERSGERRDLVLRLMADQGRISSAERERAGAGRTRTARAPRLPQQRRAFAPYFTDLVRRQLEARFGDELYAARLRIHTTLDRSLQQIAEEELGRQLRAIERGRHGRFDGRAYTAGVEADSAGSEFLQGAVVVLGADSGDVLALVGGRDFEHSPFNRAVLARRQVGSAFKPFVYATALAEGYSPSQHLADDTLRLELEGGEVWEPRNYDGRFAGELSLRDALVRSKNVPTVRLAAAVGIDDVATTARNAGVQGEIPTLPSMALGTIGMTPIELAAAYTPFATGGTRTRPSLIRRVTTEEGEVLWEREVERADVLDPEGAFLITDMLAEAVDRGTASAVRDAGYRGPAAGKTGTTNDGTDTWFVGYTPDLVASIWIGFDRPRTVAGDASAGRLVAPVWGRLMRRAYAGRAPANDWVRPAGVIQLPIDPQSGLVLAQGCEPERGRARSELFIDGTQPPETCPQGGEDSEPGFLARTLAWLRGALTDAGQWLAARFGGGQDLAQERRRRDEILGAPRLPRAAEVRTPRIEPELLGRPVELDELDEELEELGEAEAERLERELEQIAEEVERGERGGERGPGAARGPRPRPGDTILVLEPSDSGPVLVPVQVDTSARPDGAGRLR